MGFNIAYGYVNCWRCGRHRLDETLEEVLGLPRSEVRKVFREIDLDKSAVPVKKRGKLVVPPCVGPLERPHIRYLQHVRRLYVKEAVQLWDLGGIGLRGTRYNLQWRIYIPIYLHGEQVSWTTRSISDTTKKKYRTAHPEEEAVSHKEVLYGADYARGTILIFEGPPDVWKVGPGAVCTFGTQWSWDQLLKIVSFPRRIICYDNEETAQHMAKEMKKLLDLYDGETENKVLDRRARDFSLKQVNELRRLL